MMSAFRGVLAWIAAAAMIGAAAGCGASRVAHPTTATTSVEVQGQSACTELNGTVDPDGACHVRSTTPTYTIDMSFPLDYPDMAAVGAFLKRNRDDFTDWVTEVGPGQQRGRPYQYFVTAKTFRSATRDSGTQSLVLKIDNDTGLAHEGHPNTTFRAFNFDLAKHVPITFDTLFKPGTRPLDVLNPIVRRALDAPTAELDEDAYQNFAITNDAVIFFFGQDQVVHDNAGPHKVRVPRDELAAMLA